MIYHVLTLHQPRASLVALGAKQYETRSWSTTHRGPLVIHAAKRFARAEIELCFTEPFRSCLSKGGITKPRKILLGACLCLVDLVDIIPTEAISPTLSEQELAFGNYQPGRYAWKLENVRVFPEPIPARGQQKLWTIELTKEQINV